MLETIFACANMHIVSPFCIKSMYRKKTKGFVVCIFIVNDIALLIFSSKIVNQKFQEINLLDWFATNVFVRPPVNQKKYRCSSSFPRLFSSSLLEYSQLRDFSNLHQLWTSSLFTVNLENILSVDHDRKCFLFLVFNPLQVWEV